MNAFFRDDPSWVIKVVNLKIRFYCILSYFHGRRLRAHGSSSPHGAGVAGPLHRHIQAQAGGVLGLPGAAEGPRLGESEHRSEEQTACCHVARYHSRSSGPSHLFKFPGTFSKTEGELRGKARASGRGRVPACRETAWKAAEGLNANQLLLKPHHNNIYTAAFSCDLAHHRLRVWVSFLSVAVGQQPLILYSANTGNKIY